MDSHPIVLASQYFRRVRIVMDMDVCTNVPSLSFDPCIKLSAAVIEPFAEDGLVNTSRKQVRVTNTPYTPLLYSKTGVYRSIHFFLFLLQNIDCGYSLEPPH